MGQFRHLDLFSGIGGFALAASWVWREQHEIHSFVEIEPFAQKILKKHWPEVPIHDDIKTYAHDGTAIDLISGGFPCQPYSVAGKRRGADDYRALWPEMLRVIKEAQPNWVVGENVANFANMGLDDCLFDLEGEGYETTSVVIPACAVGANHRRDRVWIIANTNGSGRETSRSTMPQRRETEVSMPWDSNERFKWDGWAFTESQVCRANDGVPKRVDRIKGLGNAIVPHVAAAIFECIKIINEELI